VHLERSELEQHISALQSEIDRLTMTLRLWRESPGQVEPLEKQLAELAERCTAVVDGAARIGERLQQDVAARMEDLCRAVHQEWSEVRAIHEASARHLAEQAAALGEAGTAAANSAASGFERAEARLAALDADLHDQLSKLTDLVQSAVFEVRSLSNGQALVVEGPDSTAPLQGGLPMRSEVHLSNPTGDWTGIEASPQAGGELPEALETLSERIDRLERTVDDLTPRSSRLKWVVPTAVFLVLVGTIGTFTINLQRQVAAATARIAESERQAQAEAQAASASANIARDEAARQIADARAAAARAQTIGDILAAPDLVRYTLTGSNATASFYARVLWSRSRGFVFSGSHLPPPAPRTTYQVWLLTTGAPVSIGTFVPDAEGSVTLVSEAPPAVPHPVEGVSVTVEATGGSTAPSGVTLLARAQ
jgi:hypothetical protein